MDSPLRDRPPWTEVVAVLAVCAAILAGLAKLDGAAAREEARRAQQVLADRARGAEQAAPVARHSGVAAVHTPARSRSATASAALLDAEHRSMLLAAMAACGILMAFAGAAILARSG